MARNSIAVASGCCLSPTDWHQNLHRDPTESAVALSGGCGDGRPLLSDKRAAEVGRTSRFDSDPANGRFRRVSSVTTYSGDRLLSEPTAATHPCLREPLFMPHTGRSFEAQ